MSLRPRNQEGFTLWESLLSISISAFIVSLACGLAVNLSRADGALITLAESHAMQLSAERILTEDVHAATSVTVSSGTLYVTEAGGTKYQYLVNPSGQFVRYQSNGGTTVIAAGVGKVFATFTDPILHVEIDYQSGQTEVLSVADIPAMSPKDPANNTT